MQAQGDCGGGSKSRWCGDGGGGSGPARRWPRRWRQRQRLPRAATTHLGPSCLGPPGPLAFSCFRFSPPPPDQTPPGPPLTENSISHRQDRSAHGVHPGLDRQRGDAAAEGLPQRPGARFRHTIWASQACGYGLQCERAASGACGGRNGHAGVARAIVVEPELSCCSLCTRVSPYPSRTFSCPVSR